MTLQSPIILCLFSVLALKANAFTAGPQVTIEALDVPQNQGYVTFMSPASASKTMTSTSNLPSQRQLLDKVTSLTVASASKSTTASPPKSSNAAKVGGISITDIFFDGKVPRTESDEYVIIQNSSKDTVDVSGYIVYPATSGNQGSTFTFPNGSKIKPNSSVRIYTNEIHQETGGYSWGSGKALWSNSGGLAVLKDNTGKKLGEYKYIPPSKSS